MMKLILYLDMMLMLFVGGTNSQFICSALPFWYWDAHTCTVSVEPCGYITGSCYSSYCC